MREVDARWEVDELGPAKVMFLRPMPRMGGPGSNEEISNEVASDLR
jgi:hypothetical protein